MKLHLPTRLRKALLAAFTVSSVMAASAAGVSADWSSSENNAGIAPYDGVWLVSSEGDASECAAVGCEAGSSAGDSPIVGIGEFSFGRPVIQSEEDLTLAGLLDAANELHHKTGSSTFNLAEGGLSSLAALVADDLVISCTNYFMEALSTGAVIDAAAETAPPKELPLTDTVSGSPHSGKAQVRDADLTLEAEDDGEDLREDESAFDLSEEKKRLFSEPSALNPEENRQIFSEMPLNPADERMRSVYEYFMKEGSLQKDDAGTIMIDTGQSVRFEGELEDSTDYYKTGEGTLILNTPSSYKGTFHLSEGTLAVQSSNAYGSESTLLIDGTGVTLQSGTLGGDAVYFDSALAVDGNREFTVDTLSDTVWSGLLEGRRGLMNKTGAANLEINNAQSQDFAAAIRVNEGSLALNGRIGSSIVLEKGTMLSGNGFTSGHVAALGDDTVIEIGGAGDRGSMAVLTVGSLSLRYAGVDESGVNRSGTKVIFDLDIARNAHDRLVVAGKAELNQAVVEIRTGDDIAEQELSLSGDERYTLVEAGEISGTFQTDVQHGFYLHNAHIEYTDRGADLVLSLNYKGVGKNANQTRVSDALQSLDRAGSASGALGGMMDALDTTRSSDDARAALDSAGGVSLTTTMGSLIAGGINHLRTLRSSMGDNVYRVGLAGSESGPAAVNTDMWFSPVTGYNRAASDSNAPGFSRSSWGGLMGLERRLTQNALAGLALGYDHARTSVTGERYESDHCTIDLYGSFRSGQWQHRASVGVGFHDFVNDRFVTVGDRFGRESRGRTDGLSLNLSYELSYEFALGETSSIAPLFTIESSLNRIDGYSEGGAIGNAGLTLAKQDAWATVLGMGVRHTQRLFLFNGAPAATVELSALLTADVGDQGASVEASFLGAPGKNFTLAPASMNRVGGLIGAGMTVPVTERFSTFGGINFEFRDDTRDLNANAGVRYIF